MRIITIKRADTGEERKTEGRALKRKEIKELKEYGCTPIGWVPSLETVQDAMDRVFDKIFTPDDLSFLDECDNQEANRVFNEILKETYGSKDEEKNSKTTTDGTLTEKE